MSLCCACTVLLLRFIMCWRDCSAVRSTGCSSEDRSTPGYSQHPAIPAWEIYYSSSERFDIPTLPWQALHSCVHIHSLTLINKNTKKALEYWNIARYFIFFSIDETLHTHMHVHTHVHTLVWSLQPHWPWWHTPVTPALGRGNQEVQNSKAIFSYLVRLRQGWHTWDLDPKNKNKKVF